MSKVLENVFDIEEGSTENPFSIEKNNYIDLIDPKTGEVTELGPDASEEELEHAEKIEDLLLQQQYDTIYKKAVNAYEQQIEMTMDVDPKFSARNAEVAAQFLSVALNATKDRTEAKFKRAKIKSDKNYKSSGSPSTVNNNVILTDRNELMKLIKGQS